MTTCCSGELAMHRVNPFSFRSPPAGRGLFPRLALAALTTFAAITPIPSPRPVVAGEAERTTVLSLQGLDCASCFGVIEVALKKVKGVRRVDFDRRTVETTVHTRGAVAPDALIAAVEKAGFKALEGPGRGRWLPPEGFPKGADVGV